MDNSPSDRLSNPFANESNVDIGGEDQDLSGGDNGFISFSSSTPRQSEGRGFSGGRNFNPRRGKRNRQSNWERFGEFNQGPPQQQQYFYSNRGSPGGFRGMFYPISVAFKRMYWKF